MIMIVTLVDEPYNLNAVPTFQLSVTDTDVLNVPIGDAEATQEFATAMQAGIGELSQWWVGRFAVNGVVAPEMSLDICLQSQGLQLNSELIWGNAEGLGDTLADALPEAGSELLDALAVLV
jgi:hypothetical protein